jgi:uncharacterized protein (TIGR02118 family)
MKTSGLTLGRRNLLRFGALLAATAAAARLPFATPATAAETNGLQNSEKTGMLKLSILARRRPDLTHEQFLSYWRDGHAELYSSQPDTKRYVRRYIQSRIAGDAPHGFVLADIDGIAQVWFDDMDGFNAFYASPSYINVIQPDELKFTDPKRCEYFFSREYPIIG